MRLITPTSCGYNRFQLPAPTAVLSGGAACGNSGCYATTDIDKGNMTTVHPEINDQRYAGVSRKHLCRSRVVDVIVMMAATDRR